MKYISNAVYTFDHDPNNRNATFSPKKIIKFDSYISVVALVYVLGPKEFCNGKPPHGNFKLIINSVLLPNHYLACSGGFAYCMPCAPASPKLVYNEKCDKCLFPDDSCKFLQYTWHTQ